MNNDPAQLLPGSLPQAVEEVNAKLAKGTFRRVQGTSVATTVEPATDYYLAEDYHQQVWADCMRGLTGSSCVVWACVRMKWLVAARNMTLLPIPSNAPALLRSTWHRAAGMDGRRMRARARRIASGAMARRLNSRAGFSTMHAHE